MSRAYIVEGTTGEYSDYSDWPVAVFTSRGRALRFTARANAWLKEHELHRDSCTMPFSGRQDAPRPVFDPQLRVDYTGADYHCLSVTLDPELPLTIKNGANSC
jgi:hypothetical protein